ncbi:MAG: formyltransferase family protein [Dissulfurispiraceae bacterium]|nr:formyltransferase family protein [Dissulfurispiraceae bacterium]
MKISILCSSKEHPVYKTLVEWQKNHIHEHEIELIQLSHELSGGDILFLISCNELINKDIRDRYKATLVIHASNLPEGRGWSPHIWQIVMGKNTITVTLLEAEDKLDRGAIWSQRELTLEGHELYDEINNNLFTLEIELMDFAIANFYTIVPKPQSDKESTYFTKRTPNDSRIDPEKTILEQFDLLRVADPARFPAFFDLRGYRYLIKIEKTDVGGA